MDKAEEADRITFKEATTKNLVLIAQNCAPHEGCDVVHTPGVSVLVAGECVRVTIQNVNISRSGLYTAVAYFGKHVYEKTATLVVNKAPVSSSPAPPHSSSSPKPPRSSGLQWLYALLPVVLIIIIIILVYCFWKHRKAVRNMKLQIKKKQPQKPQLSPNPDPVSQQQKELETMIV
ncbi:hypothetical protein R3I94_017581 [Phoxinus phoxinus]